MSTIRIDERHQKLLDRLLAHFIFKGKKNTKKQLIGELIEKAARNEGLSVEDAEICPLDEDPAWTNLEDCFSSGLTDLSEHVDEYLYS